jgi:hypothetical protein
MANSTLQVMLTIVDPGSDSEELDRLAIQLRRRLLELDVDSVERISAGEAPPGTRAVEIAVVGALLLTMAKSPELLSAVGGLVHSWVDGRPGATVEMTLGGDSIKIPGTALSPEQRQLFDLFVARNAGGE